MRILGVIPARGGSKRLPNKNIADLGGKPLIAWSIEVGLATCAELFVSTDEQTIAGVSRSLGVKVIDRPRELATDDATSMSVVLHATRFVREHHFAHWDAVLVLQPTSPFRTADDVRATIDLFERNHADSVISLVRYPKEDALFKLGLASRMRPAENGAWTTETIYMPNGAVYLIGMEHLLRGGDLYGPYAYGYVMPPERSLDIDTHADIDAARAMLNGQVMAVTSL
jgi:CMP-N-acetylneuraminic acid synthetase